MKRMDAPREQNPFLSPSVVVPVAQAKVAAAGAIVMLSRVRREQKG
jgi:hypothetical protein